MAYPGGLDLLVFIGKCHYGLLEDDKLGPCGIFQTFLEGGKNQQNELICLWAVAQKTSRKHQLFFEISDFTAISVLTVV